MAFTSRSSSSPSRQAVPLLSSAAAAVAAVFLVSSPVRSQVIDNPNDILSTFTAGPVTGDLDVLSSAVTLVGNEFVFTATLNAAVGTNPNTLYVWGVNRGTGTARLNTGATPLGPNILFDSVVVLNAGGTGTVNLFGTGQNTTLGAGDIAILGNTITATVAVDSLPTQGFALEEYTWNLWPRLGTGNNNQISDFAPDNSNAPVTVAGTVPEVGTGLLCSLGVLPFAGLALIRRRRLA